MPHCLWHAIEYQGGTCPRCWQEKQQERLTDEIERISQERAEWEEERDRREAGRAEELTSRIEASNLEAAMQMEMQLRAAAEEQRRNIAHKPRLEAQGKSERASELYQAGLYEDAFQTSLEAIKLDRGNLKATQITASALMKQGRESEAAEYFRRQLALLNTPDYMNSPAWFRSVLLELPDDDAFLQAFSDALQKNSGWFSSNDSFDLIEVLMDRELMDDAKVLIETLIRKGDSLMLQAYLLEINGRSGMSSSENLSAFLQTIPFNRRSDLLDSFQASIKRKGRLSDTTVSGIKAAISERYNRWKPQIEKNISEAAIQEAAKSAGFGVGWGCGFVVVCFVAVLIIANILHSAPLKHLWLVTDGMKVFAPVSVFASLIIGLWGGRVVRGFRKAADARQRMEAMEQAENERWQSINLKPISAHRTDLSFVYVELIVLLFTFGLILFVLFSYLSSTQEAAIRALNLGEDSQRLGADEPRSQTTPLTSAKAETLNGVWVGEWSNPTSSPGYIFRCEINLKTSSVNEVTGSIAWNLRASPRPDEPPKIGTNATEYLKGSYDPERRLVDIEGYKKDDPHGIITLDRYQLLLSVDGQTLGGKTYSYGGWDGRLSAHKKGAEMKDAVANFGGTYYIYHVENPTSGLADVMTISARGNSFFVRGDNENWKGEGRIEGTNGYYDWRFKDGRKGRTTFSIDSEGTLRGHVIGSGADWWYVARRP